MVATTSSASGWPKGFLRPRPQRAKPARRVLLGSSWINNARNCQSAMRKYDDPDRRKGYPDLVVFARQRLPDSTHAH